VPPVQQQQQRQQPVFPVPQQQAQPNWSACWNPPVAPVAAPNATPVAAPVAVLVAPVAEQRREAAAVEVPQSKLELQIAMLDREAQLMKSKAASMQHDVWRQEDENESSSSRNRGYSICNKSLYRSEAHRIVASRPIPGGTVRGSSSAYCRQPRTSYTPTSRMQPLKLQISAYEEEDE